jgi:anaerobic magnesium-protoporphyrin IX monomethyl ester cyclase
MGKVLLCIPPDYDYNFPPLATPALCAFLKTNGINAFQADLNLAYREFLVDKIHSPGLNRQAKRSLLRNVLKEFFAKKLKNRYYSNCLPRLSDEVSLSLPYENNSNSSFYFTERLLSSDFLFRYLEDSQENTFLQFYERQNLIRFLKKEAVNLLGISIISPSQAIAGLTLGLLVKKEFPRAHVNIGGQWPTLFRKEIIKRQDLFRCFDSLIVFEGETPLCELAKALESKRPLKIPNVILKGSSSDHSSSRTEEIMDSLPAPDFAGLPLSGYFGSQASSRSLTFETSRGCYWSKCAYCVDLPLPKPSYRFKSAELVVRDMKILQKKYKASNLMFGDPGLSPRQMLAISEEILRQRLKIGWWTMARLDPGFTRRIFDIAWRAGLTQINFGFESACDRICDLLDKGNHKVMSQRIIRDCSGSGIKVDLQTMIGLPNEKLTDGLETVDFLVTNKEFIDDVTFNVYYLTPSNHVYLDPGKYGVQYKRGQGLPFRFFTPFKNIRGMNNQDADLLQKIYLSLAFKARKKGIKNLKRKEMIKKGRLEFSLAQEDISLKYVFNRSSGVIELR